MTWVAVQSHLLATLLTSYFMISILLLCSGLYIEAEPHASNKSKNGGKGVDEIDIDRLKIITSITVHAVCVVCIAISLLIHNITKLAQFVPPMVIVTILIFTLIFNIVGCMALWIHKAKDFPGGYSRAIRGGAVMSTYALVHDIICIFVYCQRCPMQTTQTQPKSGEGGGESKVPSAKKRPDDLPTGVKLEAIDEKKAAEEKKAKKDETVIENEGAGSPTGEDEAAEKVKVHHISQGGDSATRNLKKSEREKLKKPDSAEKS
ncbi:hypothetical protein Q1695_007306 [Nippostrongylus brasiliensis]|nr:hypothetical protein Q1695_007306 [Nippostrongylus brasiliensis]